MVEEIIQHLKYLKIYHITILISGKLLLYQLLPFGCDVEFLNLNGFKLLGQTFRSFSGCRSSSILQGPSVFLFAFSFLIPSV